jgi:tRNA pseudouridine13 synthase
MNPMKIDHILNPPLLTADLPGIGGRIKAVPEDFEVEEIPAYEPCGSGEFLYLWVEKRDMGAEYFVRQVARRLDIPVGEIGTAGMKDRHAVTRQTVSVPGQIENRLGQLEGEGIRVLKMSRHGNKLRPGHLHGNRFNILVRDPLPNSEQILQPLLHQLRSHGLPNFYGPQRFGHDGETFHHGLALLRGEKPPVSTMGRTPNLRSPFLRKLALSAVQSGLFNHYLAERMNAGLLRRILPGDVMAKVPFGGMFVVEDVVREQERFDAGEIVPAGPIFGRKTFPAAGEAAAREVETLRTFDLSPGSFAGFGKLMQGTRRHNLVALTDLSAVMEAAGVRFSFTLPAGSYATVLLREFMKTAVSEEDFS